MTTIQIELPDATAKAAQAEGLLTSEILELLGSNLLLTIKVGELERKLDTHDKAIVGLLSTLRELMQPPEPSKHRPIGLVIDRE